MMICATRLLHICRKTANVSCTKCMARHLDGKRDQLSAYHTQGESSGVCAYRKFSSCKVSSTMHSSVACNMAPTLAVVRTLCTDSQSPHSGDQLKEGIRLRLDSILDLAEMRTLMADKQLQELCHFYIGHCLNDRNEFLRILATEYGVNQTAVLYWASKLSDAQNRGAAVLLRNEQRLKHTLVPRYQKLFTQIGHIESGVKFLVDFRTDLLNLLSSHDGVNVEAHLHTMNICLRDLLSLWFSVGFLQLERITWQSSCDMLQKISEYEAVHPIRNWTDLKRRVGPYRRCFVFTHKSMPYEPVIVLHTALTNEISNSIQSIVQNRFAQRGGSNTPELSEDQNCISTAMFYSITSTQKGLQGIEMGNYLIKSVVRELRSEFPRMQQFSSLSPIPGFRDWLIGEINAHLHRHAVCEEDDELLLPGELTSLAETFRLTTSNRGAVMERLKTAVLQDGWANDTGLASALADPLLRLCARYLYVEKRRGFACNPVAHFHLRNGATLWRLNWLADMSQRGYNSSCGIMVNYRYFLSETERNSKLYIEQQQITASQHVLDLIPMAEVTSDDTKSKS